ncbi:MAG: aminoacyl-tRNA hydrolase [Treponema sp.]
MIEAIAFLGNYGNEYSKTRHNVAWMFCEKLELTKNLNWQNKFNGNYTKISIPSKEKNLHFIKPHTYMNLSGVSVGELCAFYKIKPSSLLVVHDEVELPLATISLKYSGGLAGHNGLRSIKEALGTQDFWRLRIGIERPCPKGEKNIDMASYVLSRFSSEQEDILYKNIAPINEIFSHIEKGNELEDILKTYSKVKLVL